MTKNILKSNKKGFALVFVLLFVVLLLITATTIWATGMAEIRLQRRSEFTEGAYQMAKAGMDSGWIKYQDSIGNAGDIPAVVIPATGNCNAPFSYFRTFSDGETVTSIATAPLATKTIDGVYDYRICNLDIFAIGYYKGNKVMLKGTISHPSGEFTEGDPNALPPTSDTRDHSDDTLTITQL